VDVVEKQESESQGLGEMESLENRGRLGLELRSKRRWLAFDCGEDGGATCAGDSSQEQWTHPGSGVESFDKWVSNQGGHTAKLEVD
jgi:hypothetical protein